MPGRCMREQPMKPVTRRFRASAFGRYSILPLFLAALLSSCLIDTLPRTPGKIPPKTPSGDKPAPTAPVPEKPSTPPRPLVFFIGNSITHVHEIPGRFRRIVEKRGYPAGYEGTIQSTPGGYNLQSRLNHDHHFAGPALADKPKFILLQEQSVGPRGNYSNSYVPYYLAVAAQIDSEVLYYQTWHADAWSNSVTEYEGSVNALNNESPPIGIALAPAGLAWNKIYATDSTLKFDPDDIHQDERGASINAAVFYYTLFPKAAKLEGILSLTGLSIEAALEEKWNTIIHDTVRTYSYAELKGPGFPANLLENDAVGGTIEGATVLERKSTQTIDVSIGVLDVDTYRLPAAETGERLRISFSPAIDIDGVSRFVGGPNIAVFDEKGRPPKMDRGTYFELDLAEYRLNPGENYYISIIGDHKITANDTLRMTVTILPPPRPSSAAPPARKR